MVSFPIVVGATIAVAGWGKLKFGGVPTGGLDGSSLMGSRYISCGGNARKVAECVVVIGVQVVGVETKGYGSDEIPFDSPSPCSEMVYRCVRIRHVVGIIGKLVGVEFDGPLFHSQDEFEGIVCVSVNDGI